MSSERSRVCLVRLLQELCALPRMSEWVEYKLKAMVPGGSGAAPQADALPALLGHGSKGGTGMSQVLDGHLIGGFGRLSGLCLTNAEAAP